MKQAIRVGLDAMGGDFAPQAPIAGAVEALRNQKQPLHCVLIGEPEQIHAELKAYPDVAEQFEVVAAEGFVAMDESPSRAIMTKPNVSINVGARMLAEQKLDVFLSAGSTGAVVVAGVLGLGMIEGLSRPVIGAFHPHENGDAMICDVGANPEAKAELLLQFGLLGSVFMREVRGIPNPRVALVNIGEEKSKGTQAVQAAYELFDKQNTFQFVGNVEGRDFVRGAADVFVCDGFVGNIILKFAESIYDLVSTRQEPHPLIQRYNYETIGGLPIMGVKGNIIIGHGISSPQAFTNMILRGVELAEAELWPKMEAALGQLQQEQEAH